MSESANHDGPPPLAEAVGGALGIAESVLPSAAFVAAYSATGQQTQPALIAAVALGAFFAVARVVRRQPARFALAGLVGIAISAYVVSRTGRAKDFFLPGLLANAGYALAYAISIAVRWPLLGVVIAIASNCGMEWRQDPARVRAYSRASREPTILLSRPAIEWLYSRGRTKICLFLETASHYPSGEVLDLVAGRQRPACQAKAAISTSKEASVDEAASAAGWRARVHGPTRANSARQAGVG
jgi:Protein of unknown function (DUF3159)